MFKAIFHELCNQKQKSFQAFEISGELLNSTLLENFFRRML